jgi:hypothetical protein
VKQHRRLLGLTSCKGRDSLRGQKGRHRYREEEETSLDFSLSSLVLARSVGAFAELQDFVGYTPSGV